MDKKLSFFSEEFFEVLQARASLREHRVKNG
jgi:hypothetical protein